MAQVVHLGFRQFNYLCKALDTDKILSTLQSQEKDQL